jgi:hypothetical protein
LNDRTTSLTPAEASMNSTPLTRPLVLSSELRGVVTEVLHRHLATSTWSCPRRK